MANNLTDAEEARLLDLSLPIGGGIYLALFTVVGDAAGAGWLEPPDDTYQRMALAVPAAVVGVGKVGPAAEILFPAATTDEYDVVGIGVWTAQTNGNLRWKRPLALAEQRTIKLGDQYRVAANSLTFTIG